MIQLPQSFQLWYRLFSALPLAHLFIGLKNPVHPVLPRYLTFSLKRTLVEKPSICSGSNPVHISLKILCTLCSSTFLTFSIKEINLAILRCCTPSNQYETALYLLLAFVNIS